MRPVLTGILEEAAGPLGLWAFEDTPAVTTKPDRMTAFAERLEPMAATLHPRSVPPAPGLGVRTEVGRILGAYGFKQPGVQVRRFSPQSPFHRTAAPGVAAASVRLPMEALHPRREASSVGGSRAGALYHVFDLSRGATAGVTSARVRPQNGARSERASHVRTPAPPRGAARG